MTTCADIVTLALVRLRQLRAGDTPQANEAADGLTALQSLYDGWVASGLFGRLNDTIISANYTALEQDRVINDGGYTVTLPLTYSNAIAGSYYPMWPDERTWSALQTTVSRPPRDLAMIEVQASGTLTRSLYDARQRAWVTLNGLTLASAAPLANRGVQGLASCLAEAIADDYGVQVTPGISNRAATFLWGLSARYDNQRVAGMQDYF